MPFFLKKCFILLNFFRSSISALEKYERTKAINKPKAARAVANACAKNPYAPKVPCHRVIRSDGTLGGFSSPGGTKTKKKMLKKEGFSL